VREDFIHIEEKERPQDEMGHLYILKLSVFIVIGLFFIGCTALPENRQWGSAEELRMNLTTLQTGDILVKNRKWDPLSWYGHAAIMVDEKNIGDYPKIGVGYYEIDSYSWLYERRDVIILRYKNFDERFKKKLLENIEIYKDRGYWIGLNKRSDKRFYCSQFVWYIYWRTAKDLGYDLDLDSNGGIIVGPYDFLGSGELEQVYIGGVQEE